MPIARFQMPDGRIARFEVPDGTTPDQAQLLIEQHVNESQQQAPQPAQEPSLGEKLLGAGEAALTAATGAIGAPLGMIGGTIGGIAGSLMSGKFGTPEAQRMVEEAAVQGAGQLTYQPRTQQGQEYAQSIGKVAENLAPLAVIAPQLAALGATASPAANVARTGAPIAANRVIQAATGVPQKIKEVAGTALPKEVPPVSEYAPVGANTVNMAEMRQQKAAELPVPVTLTKGAAEREAAQLAFEKEAAKSPQYGAPLRQRAEENNIQLLGNFDKIIDSTGAAAPDIAATGNKVIDALAEGYKSAKNKTNVLYKKFRDSEEAKAIVNPSEKVSIGEGENQLVASPIDYINEQPTGLQNTQLTDYARKAAIKLGIADEAKDGSLIAKPATAGAMEDWRRQISGAAGYEPSQIRDATILKKLIDAQVEPVVGDLGKAARAARREQAMKYENRAIVARLVQNVRGMDDPRVAADQVFNKTILNSSPEEITFLKRVMVTGGENGQTAWKELQGALARHIKDEATKGMGMDAADNPIVSPHKLNQTISALDKNGRLDIVFGKKNAAIVRDLNDVVRYVNTVPPGTLVNNSGTAGMLLAALAESGATGALTGLPLPILTGLKALKSHIANKKIALKIDRALNKGQ